MENEMEATLVRWENLGIMENKMKTNYRGGVFLVCSNESRKGTL